MGLTPVYNTGKPEKAKDGLELTFGMFFDGTLNNKNNTDLRIRYRNSGHDPASGKEAKPVYTEEEQKKIDQKISNDTDAENQRYKAMNAGTYNPVQEEKDYLNAAHRSFIERMGVDNSYSNDYTNPARIWTCCIDPYRTYIEGIGTNDKEHDIDAGFQFGSGKTGIRGKVRKGCEVLAKKIVNANNDNQQFISKVTIDVFGFSRGAAAARHFIYQVNLGQPYTPDKVSELSVKIKKASIPVVPLIAPGVSLKIPVPVPTPTINTKKVDEDGNEIAEEDLYEGRRPRMGFLGHALLKRGFTEEDLEELEVIVRFAGVYETVSSYEEFGDDVSYANLAIHATLGPEHYFGNDIKQLHLNTLRARKIVHFTAMDEHRKNFSLTRLLGGVGVEKDFPGVHCDIGGAYETRTEYVDEIETTVRINYWQLKNFRDRLIEEHWYKKNQLKISLEWKGYIKLSGTRFLKKEYSYIPLHFMVDYAKEFMEAEINSDITSVYPIDNDEYLVQAKKRLKKYVMDNGVGEHEGKWLFIPDEELQERAAERKKKELMEQRMKMEEEQAQRSMGPRGSMDNTHVVQPLVVPIEQNKYKTLPEIVVVGHTDQGILRILRNQYLHWSSNKDWFGMEPPTGDRKRVEEQEKD